MVFHISFLLKAEGQAHRVTVKQLFDLYNLLFTATGYFFFYCCSLTGFIWLTVVLSSDSCNGESLVCVFDFFLEERFFPMACITSEAAQWCRVSASCRVKEPSLVRRTPLHTAVLRSSSPISCTTLRKYFWVSLIHCTSVRTGKTIS